MEKQQLVSVIMGVYNCATTVSDAIESILNQSYQNWELIICDDCSTDSTYEIIKEYEKKYPNKIKCIKNTQNSYLSATLNHCLMHASGELIARMDGDDISVKDRLSEQVIFLENNKEIDLVGTAMKYFGEVGVERVITKKEYPTKTSLKKYPPFHHASIMTYKRVYDQLGGYVVSKRTRRGQDFDLWYRFYREGFVGANLSEPLYLCREDLNAIKRRTISVRWNTFRTMILGYKMLNYPIRWYIIPVLELSKCLIPSKIIILYRKMQG